jgi:hypothetical protein
MPAQSWKDLMNKAEEGAKEFAILDEGMYAFVIKDAAKVGQTSKENPKFTINPSVEAGPRANARVFHDFIVSDSAYAMKNFFFGDLAILGLGATFFDSNPTEQQIAQALQGKRFVAEVYHEEGNNGKTYARLRNFAAPTSAPPSAGVPGGLPVASAPVVSGNFGAPVAPAPVVAAPASDSPWATAPAAPAGPGAFNSVPMPPSFG